MSWSVEITFAVLYASMVSRRMVSVFPISVPPNEPLMTNAALDTFALFGYLEVAVITLGCAVGASVKFAAMP